MAPGAVRRWQLESRCMLMGTSCRKPSAMDATTGEHRWGVRGSGNPLAPLMPMYYLLIVIVGTAHDVCLHGRHMRERYALHQ